MFSSKEEDCNCQDNLTPVRTERNKFMCEQCYKFYKKIKSDITTNSILFQEIEKDADTD